MTNGLSATVRLRDDRDRETVVAALRQVAQMKRSTAEQRAWELDNERRAGTAANGAAVKVARFLADAQLLELTAETIGDAQPEPAANDGGEDTDAPAG